MEMKNTSLTAMSHNLYGYSAQLVQLFRTTCADISYNLCGIIVRVMQCVFLFIQRTFREPRKESLYNRRYNYSHAIVFIFFASNNKAR